MLLIWIEFSTSSRYANNYQSGSDFHREAAKMCDVYRHSSLTISAACSASGTEGFLWERDKSESFRPGPREPARLQHLRCRQAIDHRRMIREEPIHARAWTFQETILPPRLLSFCSGEMTWECETLKQCECWRIHEHNDSGETYDDMGRAAYRRFTKSIMLDGCSAGESFESDPQAEPPNLDGQVKSPEQVEDERNQQLLVQFFSTTTREKSNLGAYSRYLQNLKQARLDTDASLRHSAERARRVSWEPVTERSIFSRYSTAFEQDEPENALQDALDSDEKPSWDEVKLLLFNNDHLRVYYSANLERKQVDQPKIEAFYRYWRRTLVPEYTRRRISKDEDRLTALQAVAGDILSRIRDQYCAGLWRRDLIRQLCWKSQSQNNTSAANQSPSWSWSSIRGPIVPCLDASTEDTNQNTIETPGNMEIEDVTCKTINSNPCGQLLGGCIKLYAWALDVEAFRNRECIEFFQRKQGALQPIKPRLEFFPDTTLECGMGQQFLRRKEDDSDVWTDLSFSADFDSDELPDIGAQAILILVQANDMCVLVCSPTSHANFVRRVGIGLYASKDSLDTHGSHKHFTAGMTLRRLDLV